MALGNRGRNNRPLVIDADMEFFPALSLLLAMFLAVPFPLPADLQAGAVDDDAYRPLGCTIDLPPDFHRGISS